MIQIQLCISLTVTQALEAPWGSPVVRFFDRDPHTKTIYAVHGDNAIRRRRRHSPDGVPSTTEALNEYSFEFWDTLAHLTSSISSLVYLPASGTLAATTLGYDRPPMVYLVRFLSQLKLTSNIFWLVLAGLG